jgi:predicted hydrocarbon binding protein
MIERLNRNLPGIFIRHFLMACEAEIGDYSLQLILYQAGLKRFISQQVKSSNTIEICAQEYAALQQAIRDYYGRGARGVLNRIGRTTWNEIARQAPFLHKTGFFVTRLAPRTLHLYRALEYMAAQLGGPNGQVSVHSFDQDLIFYDQTSDATYNQIAREPICWVTLGLIQGATVWAIGEEQDVDEIACKAVGADACKFRLRLNPDS